MNSSSPFYCTCDEKELIDAIRKGDYNLVKSLLLSLRTTGHDNNNDDNDVITYQNDNNYYNNNNNNDVNENSGWTPLHQACVGLHLNMIKLLINHECYANKINQQEKCGWTPLHLACLRFPSLDIIHVLLQVTTININIQNIYGDTPLHCAIKSGNNMNVIQLLIDHNASINIRNNDGYKPEDICITLSNPVQRTTIINLISEKRMTLRQQTYSWLFYKWQR